MFNIFLRSFNEVHHLKHYWTSLVAPAASQAVTKEEGLELDLD